MVELILASKSKVRKEILDNNGFNCEVVPSNLDEDMVKKSLIRENATPEIISIPDTHSRTCSAVLPDGSIYIVGNQVANGRDPVTISISRDGINFDRSFSVRYGAPPVKYPGAAKIVGFQYPAAMVLKETVWVSYSLGKEDIGVTRFSLKDLGV